MYSSCSYSGMGVFESGSAGVLHHSKSVIAAKSSNNSHTHALLARDEDCHSPGNFVRGEYYNVCLPDCRTHISSSLARFPDGSHYSAAMHLFYSVTLIPAITCHFAGSPTSRKQIQGGSGTDSDAATA
jgi:hypothetical protein